MSPPAAGSRSPFVHAPFSDPRPAPAPDDGSSPSAWDELGAQYTALLALAPGARAARLADEIARDPARARELCELLAADAAGGAALDSAAPRALDTWMAALLGNTPTALPNAEDGRPRRADPDDALTPGTAVGRYRIRREIGRGGSAVVYEAVAPDGDEVVALKLLRDTWLGTPVADRFARERHLLARIRHPHVAALRDAGLADDGRAYLALDLVQGVPIDRWCALHRVDARGRAALLIDVCAAVAHAHRQLVVHRDLKPANVLVDASGHVWLLDFGVARLLDGRTGDPPTATADVPLTRPGEGAPCTPGYAAPELLRGEPASTAADVYALGVLLYELLTGVRPHEVAGLSRFAAAAAADTLPVAPSERIAGGPLPPALPIAPSTTPAADRVRAAALVRGDLDAIALTALAPQPERRYPTVDALADDLRAWLSARGVRARPAEWREAVRRWARRHRAAAVALGVGVPIALAGVAGTAWEWRRADVARRAAEGRAEQVRGLAGTIFVDVYDGIADLPGATPVRERLAARAAEQLQRLADGALADGPLAAGAGSSGMAHDPRLLVDLARALQRLGDVRGNPTNANMGDRAAARAAFERSSALAERALAAAPRDPAVAWVAATQLERLADVRAADGDLTGAGTLVRQAVDRRRQIARTMLDGAGPGLGPTFGSPLVVTPVGAARALAITLVKLGDVVGNFDGDRPGDVAAGEAAYEEARARLAAPPLATDTAFATRRHQMLVLERLARARLARGDVPGARRLLDTARAGRAALATAHPLSVDASRDVEVADEMLTDALLGSGEPLAALPHARAAAARADSLAAADRENAQLRRDQALARGGLARAEWAVGHAAAARTALGDARVAWAAYLGGRPADPRDRAPADSLAVLADRLGMPTPARPLP